jgi:hypothetical protein
MQDARAVVADVEYSAIALIPKMANNDAHFAANKQRLTCWACNEPTHWCTGRTKVPFEDLDDTHTSIGARLVRLHDNKLTAGDRRYFEEHQLHVPDAFADRLRAAVYAAWGDDTFRWFRNAMFLAHTRRLAPGEVATCPLRRFSLDDSEGASDSTDIPDVIPRQAELSAVLFKTPDYEGGQPRLYFDGNKRLRFRADGGYNHLFPVEEISTHWLSEEKQLLTVSHEAIIVLNEAISFLDGVAAPEFFDPSKKGEREREKMLMQALTQQKLRDIYLPSSSIKLGIARSVRGTRGGDGSLFGLGFAKVGPLAVPMLVAPEPGTSRMLPVAGMRSAAHRFIDLAKSVAAYDWRPPVGA